jgi:hypothetical protein
MFYSYCAFDEKGCYGLVSACPEHIDIAAEAVKEWIADGSDVKLLPRDEAVDLHLQYLDFE